MLRHRAIDKICWMAAVFSLILVMFFGAAASCGWISKSDSIDYENRLFDTSRVHTIDIVMEDWEGFLDKATSEEYASCTLVIDGETYGDVGIRGKGNTSLSQVAAYGNDRYSFKVEFDHYSPGRSYHGLDKLSLNNLISDNTYMKDYLCYQMMQAAGAVSSLCSFAYITVNGEDWGLYLAVEGVEDGFLARNYGSDHGNLYKPDSMDFGGGRGNGAGFQMEEFEKEFMREDRQHPKEDGVRPPEGLGEMGPPEGFTENPEAEGPNPPGRQGDGSPMGGGFGGMGSSDVKLQYIDDDPESYPNIFGNAKTDVTKADKARLIASLKRLGEGEELEKTVDAEAVIRYFAAHNFVCNSDSYTGTMVHNYYLYEEDRVLSMLPWDYNLAFGGMGTVGGGAGKEPRDAAGGETARGDFLEEDSATAEVNRPIDSLAEDGDLESRPMAAWIFENEEYTALYHQCYAEFVETFFESGYFEEMLEETIALIAPFVEKDPTAFCSYEEFLAGAETLRQFCLLRAESVSGQLQGTIPSTLEGQEADKTAFVDASHISLSDMGVFSGGGPGGRHSDAASGVRTPAFGDRF